MLAMFAKQYNYIPNSVLRSGYINPQLSGTEHKFCRN